MEHQQRRFAPCPTARFQAPYLVSPIFSSSPHRFLGTSHCLPFVRQCYAGTRRGNVTHETKLEDPCVESVIDCLPTLSWQVRPSRRGCDRDATRLLLHAAQGGARHFAG